MANIKNKTEPEPEHDINWQATHRTVKKNIPVQVPQKIKDLIEKDEKLKKDWKFVSERYNGIIQRELYKMLKSRNAVLDADLYDWLDAQSEINAPPELQPTSYAFDLMSLREKERLKVNPSEKIKEVEKKKEETVTQIKEVVDEVVARQIPSVKKVASAAIEQVQQPSKKQKEIVYIIEPDEGEDD